MVTAERLKRLAPSARADLVAAIVRNWHLAEAAGITTPLRTMHFLAQIAAETGGFKALEENLNYKAKRLTQVWPARFPTLKSAQPYAGQPQLLANKVYGRRLGNKGGDDGWRYRGSGFMQTTGRANFAKAGFADNPEALREPDAGFAAALTFWADNGCNAIADRDDVTALRKRINGGTNGLAETKAYLKKARKTFADQAPAPRRPAPKASKPPAPAPAPPVPQPRPTQPGETAPGIDVFAVQRSLKARGYHVVGRIDGDPGGATHGAVTAFRLDRGMGPGGIDAALVDELGRAAVEGWTRPIAASRSEATSKEVSQVAPEAKASRVAKLWAQIQAGVAGVVAFVLGVAEYIPSAKSMLDPLRDLASDVPTPFWVAVVASVAFFTWRYSQKAETASVDAYRSGERT